MPTARKSLNHVRPGISVYLCTPFIGRTLKPSFCGSTFQHRRVWGSVILRWLSNTVCETRVWYVCAMHTWKRYHCYHFIFWFQKTSCINRTCDTHVTLMSYPCETHDILNWLSVVYIWNKGETCDCETHNWMQNASGTHMWHP